MGKVICDVCGTTYPETAAQCPICGSAKNTASQTAAGAEGDSGTASYAYVKGGRFSKKNVRRRSRSNPSAAAQRRSTAASVSSRRSSDREEPSNAGLIVVVILLMLAIISVLIYIGVQFLAPQQKPDPSGPSDSTGQSDPVPSESQSEPLKIPCTDLKLSNNLLELSVGDSWTLEVELTPVDTTDELMFASDDPAVATVSDSGEILMTGEGETVITVVCGEMSAVCTVKTPAGTVDPPVTGVFEFAFNTPFVDESTGYADTTLTEQGASWRAYKTTLAVDPELITWSSDNTAIVTIDKGIVTTVGPGTTKIHASYNGVTYTCVVRCVFEPIDTNTECRLSHKDVTLSVGQSFTLKLKDPDGYTLSVTWTANGDGVTIEGNKITATASGTFKVSATYDGKTYTCIVRVK